MGNLVRGEVNRATVVGDDRGRGKGEAGVLHSYEVELAGCSRIDGRLR
jgi:hypothetical protein